MLKILLSLSLTTTICFADISFNGNKTTILNKEELSVKVQESEKKIVELQQQIETLNKALVLLIEQKSHPKKIKAEKKPSTLSEAPAPKCTEGGTCEVVLEKVN